jgi:peptidoglycan/LPS O-acetylase OafA/YrhL
VPALGEARRGAGTGAWLLAVFGRVTSGGRFIAEIDGLRFIAIITVLLFHLGVDLQAKAPESWTMPAHGLLATFTLHGFHGVELFFVISGFVLAMPYAAHHLLGRPKVALGSYFLRRVTRLEPPYVLSLLLICALLVAVRGRSLAELAPHLAASLVYQHSLIYGEESWISNVAWSLEIEIQFYLLVPLLSGLFSIRGKARRRAVIAALCAASVALECTVLTPQMRAWMSILRFSHFFLAGFLLADLFLLDWRERPVQTLAWDLVSLAGWPLLFWIWSRYPSSPPRGGHAPLLPSAAFPVLALLLYVAVFRGRVTNRVFTTPWVTAYGGMCYSVYLIHNPTFGVLLRLTKGLVPFANWEGNFLLQALLVLPAMSVPAALFFLAVEKPCMRRDWPQRLWARLRRTAAA